MKYCWIVQSFQPPVTQVTVNHPTDKKYPTGAGKIFRENLILLVASTG